jgi:rubrerythrin
MESSATSNKKVRFDIESVIYKQVMEENRENKPKESANQTIEYIKEGQLCRNRKFARLVKEPGNIIRCPICGYGNGAGCT